MKIRITACPPMEARHGLRDGLELEVDDEHEEDMPATKEMGVTSIKTLIKRREARKRDGFWVVAPGSGERVLIFKRECEVVE